MTTRVARAAAPRSDAVAVDRAVAVDAVRTTSVDEVDAIKVVMDPDGEEGSSC